MEIAEVKAIIADAGGYDNVTQLVFDNAMFVKFVTKPQEGKLKESDFVQLGGGWFYKEATKLRDNVEYDYILDAYIYHPLECLQAIITCESPDRIDMLTMNDMMAQISG